MTSAVKPAADFISCSSPSCKKTASPAAIGSSSPSAPLTSPDPSRMAKICGVGRGMPTEPTAGLKSEDRRLDERPFFEGLCQRSDGHTIEQISTRHECDIGCEAEPFHEHLLCRRSRVRKHRRWQAIQDVHRLGQRSGMSLSRPKLAE